MDILFLVTLILEALFGLGFLFVPSLIVGLFGVTLDSTSTALARLFGSALICFPVLLWFARKSHQTEFKKGAVYSLITYYLISTILLVVARLARLMNALGWIAVGIHIILLAWFGYFLMKK